MSDIFREVDEDLRRDQLTALWKRYGSVLIGLAVLIVAATAGYVGWRAWNNARMEAQTDLLLEAFAQADPAVAGGEQVPDPQAALTALAAAAPNLRPDAAALARLYEASLRSRAGQGEAAIAIYDALAADGRVDRLTRDLALLLSVQTQASAGDAAALSARLRPLLVPGNPWRTSATEMQALLALRMGDAAQAGALFQTLAQDSEAPAAMRARAAEMAALYATNASAKPSAPPPS
jgi:hypothetical protein